MVFNGLKERSLNAVAIVSLTRDRAFCYSCPNHVTEFKQAVPNVLCDACLNCIQKRREFMEEKKAFTLEDLEKYNANP